MAEWQHDAVAKAVAAGDQPYMLETPQGTLLGSRRECAGQAICAFKGIPYAAPPTGVRRWRPAQPAASWDGVRIATAYAPDCIQPPATMPQDAFWYLGPRYLESEDCLYLNVWAPDPALSASPRPVIVWIHGGSFVSGSGAHQLYDGHALAAKGAIVVTINYRLGILGFFAHPDLSAESEHGTSGNYAVTDIVQALIWVRDNIRAFGGDASRVTVAGESAGSFLVSMVMASPLAAGLFHRAIGQSGGFFYRLRELKKSTPSRPSAESMGQAFADAIAAPDVAALRALPADQLVRLAFGNAPLLDDAGFLMTVDGWVLPDQVPNIFDNGRQNDVPVLVGFNADESSTMVGFSQFPEIPSDSRAYRAQVERIYGELAEEVLRVYPDSDPLQSILAAFDYALYGFPAERWAQAMGTVSSNAYVYCFAHHTPGAETLIEARPDSKIRMGAFHSAEIAYTFNNIDDRACYAPNVPFGPIREVDRRLAETISDLWVSFARDGVPASRSAPEWKPYRDEERNYMRFEEGEAIAAANPMPGARELQSRIASMMWEKGVGWTGGNPDLV